MPDLDRIPSIRRTGSEPFHNAATTLDFDVLDFWRWSVSDLVSNATRGRLAEYIVARALGIPTDGVRDEWAAYDLITRDKIRVEVKSAAYLQSWWQRCLSKISYSVREARAWDPETNRQAAKPTREAGVYVFALLHHQDKATLDPLNLTQWRFFVLSSQFLNARTGSQHSITLRSLEKVVGAGPYTFHNLAPAVRAAAGNIKQVAAE
jgi:hypothetical protein